jgi:uncharacterized membrane protein YvbJ
MSYCSKCGNKVEESMTFCPNCGAPLKTAAPSIPETRASQPTTTVNKLPRTGLIVTLLGLAIIFLSAIAYIVLHNVTVGIVGLIFVIIIAFFLYRGQNSADPQSRLLTGIVPMFFGFIIMALDGTALNFDIAVLLGGLLLAIGGAMLTSKK